MCPKCRSSSVSVKPAKGWERILIFCTNQRRYRCRQCGMKFRAIEHRIISRRGTRTMAPSAEPAAVQK